MNKEELLKIEALEAAEVAHNVEEEIIKTYDYHYIGSQQPQIGGNNPVPSWTGHDDPRHSDYISFCTGPL